MGVKCLLCLYGKCHTHTHAHTRTHTFPLFPVTLPRRCLWSLQSHSKKGFRVSGVTACWIFFFQISRLVFFEVCYRLVTANSSPHSTLSPQHSCWYVRGINHCRWPNRQGEMGWEVRGHGGAQKWNPVDLQSMLALLLSLSSWQIINILYIFLHLTGKVCEYSPATRSLQHTASSDHSHWKIFHKCWDIRLLSKGSPVSAGFFLSSPVCKSHWSDRSNRQIAAQIHRQLSPGSCLASLWIRPQT